MGFLITHHKTLVYRAKQRYKIKKEVVEGQTLYKLEFVECYVYVNTDFPLFFLSNSEKITLIKQKETGHFFINIKSVKDYRFPVAKVVNK